MNSASDGATITFATGTYWASTTVNLAARNGITLICATNEGCTITSGGGFLVENDCAGTDVTNLTRISGFHFTGTPGVATIWWLEECPANFAKVRIDHNHFDDIGLGVIGILFASSPGHVWGVIDHNRCTGAQSYICIKSISGGTTWSTGLRGTANNLFFEDNECNLSVATDLGYACVDVWKATGFVTRFNTFHDSRLVNHGLCHGGPASSENYGNDITSPDNAAPNYRNMHFQGAGELVAFNNRVDGGHMALQHYRSEVAQLPQGDCVSGEECDGDFVAGSGIPQTDGNRASAHGYPCWHQPGRDDAATLKPVYFWLNKDYSNVRFDVSIETGGFMETDHFLANRDYYQAGSINAQSSPTSPFNGTSGVGHGTLANRPTTCTAGPGGLDGMNGGVTYWATNIGAWNRLTGVASGLLFRCTATNTWSAEYAPYTYPHPLQGDAGTPDAPSTPRIN